MSDTARHAGIWLGAAVIAMGLLAGLVYDWAIAVMPALTAADDRTLVDATQQTLDNPAFPLTFLAAGALAAVALFQARRSGPPEAARWIVAGLAQNIVRALATTAAFGCLTWALVLRGRTVPDQVAADAAASARAARTAAVAGGSGGSP